MVLLLNAIKRRARARKEMEQQKQHQEQQFTQAYAEKIARKVASTVDIMLGGSPLFGCPNKKNETYGLFHRNEVKLGRRLGSGGFSDVYEIEGFKAASDDTSRYSKCQEFSRQFYEDTAKRDNGESRYVVKHLRPKFMDDPQKFQMAAADLAVEAQFLSSLDHPHILKLRGWSSESTDSYKDGTHDGFFLILDRLHGDLSGMMEQWKSEGKRMRRNKKGSSKAAQKKALAERVKAAYQIACALDYLHDRGIIFRDLKPNNVGIDTDGNMKLFDFGLAREVPSGKNMDDVFTMSGKIGTRRYMAPEVALNQKYNLKADVYSWACNFYELLALEKPYATFSQEMHKELCCKQGYRPELKAEWPESVKALLRRSWEHDIRARPTMKQVVKSLKCILLELDSSNTPEVLEIRERRKYSVVLELPSNFDSTKNRGKKEQADGTTTLGTESLGESLGSSI